jgi:hypothetical protein
MSGEARSLVNKSDIRDLAEASDAEVQKVVEAIEKDKPVKRLKTTQSPGKEPLVKQVHRMIDDLETRTDTLTDLMRRLAVSHGLLTSKDRTDIADRVDNLSDKMQLIWQSFL